MKHATPAYRYDREVICPEPLLEALGGDWRATAEVLEVFLDDWPRMKSEVESSFDSSREDAVFALHDLAGALGASGAVQALQEVNVLVRTVRGRREGGTAAEAQKAMQRVQQFAEAAEHLLAQIRKKPAVSRCARKPYPGAARSATLQVAHA